MSALHRVSTSFEGGMKFKSEINGHELFLDVAEEDGGENAGPRPKALLLTSLMGCTGMDVASLLKKMHVEVDHFSMDCEADLTDDHPRVYSEIRLIYRFKANEEDRVKIEKAVKLSQEKYCGVSEMLKKVCTLHWEIQYL
jgi:putative redox protein